MLFSWVRLAGVLYLVVLGALSLRRALADGELHDAAGETAPDTASAFVQGLLSNVLNPKVALFYLTLLP